MRQDNVLRRELHRLDQRLTQRLNAQRRRERVAREWPGALGVGQIVAVESRHVRPTSLPTSTLVYCHLQHNLQHNCLLATDFTIIN